MRRIFGIRFLDHVQVSRDIGSRQYDQAIQRLTKNLSNTEQDVYALELIALCHSWSGHHEEAIATSKRVLEFEPSNFSSLMLLSEAHAELEQHDTAIGYVDRALAAYPEPIEPPPNFVMKLLRFAFRLTPRLRTQWSDAKRELENPDGPYQRWYKWAKQYQQWHRTQSGTKGPTVH